MTVVDSDIVIRFLRGHPETVARLLQIQDTDVIACSVITTFEVLRGATPSQLAVTDRLLSSFVQLPVTENISRAAAHEYRTFRSQNVTLAMADLLIGCTARAHQLPLLTGNVRHFPIPNLTLLSP